MKEKIITGRTFIYPKDLELITGRSGSYCRKIIREIKKANNKKPHQLVSFKEFCQYMQVPLDIFDYTI